MRGKIRIDLYSFGQTMPGRTQALNVNGYKYGMNGQEKDKEIFEGAYTAEYWEYDSRTGRRWEGDPVTYPWQSSYACFDNNPIALSDVLGLWGDPPVGVLTKTTPKINMISAEAMKKLASSSGGHYHITKTAIAPSASASGIAARSLGFMFSALLSPQSFGTGDVPFHEWKTPSNLVIIGTPAKNLPPLYLQQLKLRVESGKGSLLDHQQYNELFSPPAQAPFKTQSHHVIPVAVFKEIGNNLVDLAMSDPAFAKEINNSEWNRLHLSTEFHGNHPAYNTNMRNYLSKLSEQNQNVDILTAQKILREVAGKMKGEIISKISANPGKRLNELYGGGRSTPKTSGGSSSGSSNSSGGDTGSYQNPRFLD